MKHQSLAYNAVLRFKIFDSDDTSTMKATFYLFRVPGDSLHHGRIMATSDSITTLYDLDRIYRIDQRSKKIIVFEDPSKYREYVTPGFVRDMFWSSFLQAAPDYDPLSEMDSVTIIPEHDATINNRTCTAIKIKYPDMEGFSDDETTMFYDRATKIRIQLTHRVKFQGNYQYSKLTISSWAFDTIQPEFFSIDKLAKGYIMETYQESTTSDYDQLLAIGTHAPLLNGKFYQKNLTDTTISLTGKVTLLDFWYMACYPCNKAIPELNQVFEKVDYDKVQVYGINYYDNNDVRIPKIAKFMQYNPIRFPVLLVDKQLPENYHIMGWPTVYLIDKSGQIVYTHIGYKEGLSKELLLKIDELLQQK
jgi:thiol-disulfide isomerase/thioredoxin